MAPQNAYFDQLPENLNPLKMSGPSAFEEKMSIFEEFDRTKEKIYVENIFQFQKG